MIPFERLEEHYAAHLLFVDLFRVRMTVKHQTQLAHLENINIHNFV